MALERIRQAAELSIRRGCGFALIGIVTVLVGCSYDPLLAARAGGIQFALLAAVLVLKAVRAPALPYRRTELWLLLGRRHDLPESRAQTIICEIRREVLIRHGDYAAAASGMLWLVSFMLRLAQAVLLH